MTLFAFRARDDLLAVRFACSPVWETQAAVRTFAEPRTRTELEPWHRLARERAGRLDLPPRLACQPVRGYVPGFLAPPPQTAQPRLRAQLAEIRATPPAQVAHELERCLATVEGEEYRRLLGSYVAEPSRARDLLAGRLAEAWTALVAPFWIRVRTLLDREIEQRSRTLARHGLRRMLGELHPRIRWTKRGLSCADRTGQTVEIDERGLVLMPSVYLWPKVAAIVDEP